MITGTTGEPSLMPVFNPRSRARFKNSSHRSCSRVTRWGSASSRRIEASAAAALAGEMPAA